MEKAFDAQSHLSELNNPQVELHLLRSCLSICKINHLLRTVTPGLLDVELTQFDKSLRHSLERSNHTFFHSRLLVASLPIRDGGLGLREASVSSASAFIGSCNTSRDLTQSFLQQGNQSLTTTDENLLEPIVLLPGEDEARVRLLKQLGDGCLPCNLTSASQREIQSHVNCLILSSLKENASLRERARLNTVAAPHGGDWLRAIPNPRLGLTMSPHEFVLAARIWLGVPILPFPPVAEVCLWNNP